MRDLEAALLGVRRLLDPASPGEIASALEAVAQVFRAQLPETQGLKIYVSVLSELPSAAFKEACRKLVKTHRYPNMPVPAEFFEAASKASETLNVWEERLARALRIASRS